MHRIIFELGGLSITSWGVMLVIAFVVGIWIAERRAKKYGILRSIIPDLSLVLIIGGVVGGRVIYVLENFGYYAEYPGEIFKVWEGGLVFYGGLGLAILSGIIWLKKKRISVSIVMDVVAPSVALGLFFARIGCFLNGCCFGKPTNLPWGIVFPPNSPPRWVFDEGVALHPTQLYSSFAGVCMFVILLIVERWVRRPTKERVSGHLFLIFLILYSIWRFFIDFLRYYEAKVYLLGLTHAQITSIIILSVCVGIILIREKRNGFFKRDI